MKNIILLLLVSLSFYSHAKNESVIEKSIQYLKENESGSWVVIEQNQEGKDGFYIQCSLESRYIVCSFPILTILKSDIPGHVYSQHHNKEGKLTELEGAEKVEILGWDNAKIIENIAKKHSLYTNFYYFDAQDTNNVVVGSGVDLDVAIEKTGERLETFIEDCFKIVGGYKSLEGLSFRTEK